MAGLSAAMSRAQADAAVKFQPEENALRRMLSQAYTNFSQGRQINQGSAAMIIQAAKQAMPQLQQVYAQATGNTQQAYTQLQGDLSTLSAAADPQRAVAAREAAAATARLGEASARAQTGEVDRQSQAVAGQAQGEQNLYRKLVTDVGQIQQRQSDLQGEKGTFITAQGDKYQSEADKIANQNAQNALNRSSSVNLEKMREAAASTRQSSQQQFQSGQNQLYRTPAAAKPKKKGPTKNGQDKINAAFNDGQSLRGAGVNYNDAYALLTHGSKKLGVAKHNPVDAGAGLDLAFFNVLGPQSQRNVKAQGYTDIPKQWYTAPSMVDRINSGSYGTPNLGRAR